MSGLGLSFGGDSNFPERIRWNATRGRWLDSNKENLGEELTAILDLPSARKGYLAFRGAGNAPDRKLVSLQEDAPDCPDEKNDEGKNAWQPCLEVPARLGKSVPLHGGDIVDMSGTSKSVIDPLAEVVGAWMEQEGFEDLCPVVKFGEPIEVEHQKGSSMQLNPTVVKYVSRDEFLGEAEEEPAEEKKAAPPKKAKPAAKRPAADNTEDDEF